MRMRGRWPRAAPVTRDNHGVDNDRIGAHANLAWGWLTLIVERRSICRHEAAYRVHENCFSLHVFSHSRSSSPPPLFSPRRPPTPVETRRGSAFSRYGNTYRYYATSLAKSPKSNMKSCLCASEICRCARSLFLAYVPLTLMLLLPCGSRVVVVVSFRSTELVRLLHFFFAKRVKLLSRHL